MEFLIAFFITLIVYSLFKSGKKSKKQGKQPTQTTEQKANKDAEHKERLKQADEELITVILPTINHDK